jgi:segregation and condensation protein B
MTIEITLFKQILECAMLAAGEPLSLERFQQLFSEEERPEIAEIREVLIQLKADCESRGLNLKEVASGFCLQIQPQLQCWITRLWEKRPPRYSRALLETLALIAYRQPVTRAEIEDIRAVSISSSIVKTLMEREWICVAGHKDVPGKPALYATTPQFLDYFNLKNLQDLPSLPDLESTLKALEETPVSTLEVDIA